MIKFIGPALVYTLGFYSGFHALGVTNLLVGLGTYTVGFILLKFLKLFI